MTTSIQPAETPAFFKSYRQCRTAFLAQARSVGAVLQSHVHPAAQGPDGEELAIDVAFLGLSSARRLLVMTSGTHGYEGFVGNVLQCDSLARLSQAVKNTPDLGVLLIHGINPFGWSHYSRTNENNVDLNRNFIDFAGLPQEHPLAHEIQALNALVEPTGPQLQGILTGLQALMATHGADAVGDAVQRGQYYEPDGVGYGGNAPQWSNQTVSQIWNAYFQDREFIACIDWHTGLGNYGDPIFLCFAPPASAAYTLAGEWWGSEALSAADSSYQAGSRPQYTGLLAVAAETAAIDAGASALSIVVEFGTFAPIEAAQCLWIDRWLRHLPADADRDSIDQLQQRTRHFFNPDDPQWQASVLAKGRAIVDQAFDGLAAWHNAG